MNNKIKYMIGLHHIECNYICYEKLHSDALVEYDGESLNKNMFKILRHTQNSNIIILSEIRKKLNGSH